MAASQENIEKVLADMRNAIDNKKYTHVSRPKNIETLARLGMTWRTVVAEIYTLSYADYIKGPEIDRDWPSSDNIWVFKKYIFGTPIYIKFKIEYQLNGEVKILSFHNDNMF